MTNPRRQHPKRKQNRNYWNECLDCLMMRTQHIIFPDYFTSTMLISPFNDKWLYERKECEQKKEPNYSIIILCRKYELVAEISNEFPSKNNNNKNRWQLKYVYIGDMSRCISIIIGCIQANLSNQFELRNKTDKRNTYVCDSSQFRAHLLQFHSFFPAIHYELWWFIEHW